MLRKMTQAWIDAFTKIATEMEWTPAPGQKKPSFASRVL